MPTGLAMAPGRRQAITRLPAEQNRCVYLTGIELTMRRGKTVLYPWIMLGIEANRVMGLRAMKLMRGGKGARREARLMVTEKVYAGVKANARLMTGGSPVEAIRMYRRRVAANAKRLSKAGSGIAVRKGKRVR